MEVVTSNSGRREASSSSRIRQLQEIGGGLQLLSYAIRRALLVAHP